MRNSQDTICALATTTGGALSIIRISGNNAIEILQKIFSKNIATAQPNTIHHGQIAQDGETIDDVMVSIFRSPKSYTGEDCAEITCHGSNYIAQQILQALISNGCRMAQPGEYTQRAYLNGKMDLTQAEAVADLIASSNKATHQLALAQLKGNVSTELSLLRDKLLQLTSLLELELDFSDHEDLEFADRNELLDIANKINNRISSLAKSFETGQALKNIIKAVLNLRNKTFSERLIALIDKRGYKPSDVYLKAGITKQHFSKIKLNPEYQPSKETALAFAIVLKLSLADTKELLASAGFTLSSGSRRDLAVECLIKEGVYDIDTVNDILDELGFSTLTNRRST